VRKILLKHYVEQDLYQENNLGLTTFDISLLKMQSNFYIHKDEGDKNDIDIESDLIKNYEELQKRGKNRNLPSTDEVRELTYYLLELSGDILENRLQGVYMANDIMSNGIIQNYGYTYSTGRGRGGFGLGKTLRRSRIAMGSEFVFQEY